MSDATPQYTASRPPGPPGPGLPAARAADPPEADPMMLPDPGFLRWLVPLRPRRAVWRRILAARRLAALLRGLRGPSRRRRDDA
jgi:hypothetical protein